MSDKSNDTSTPYPASLCSFPLPNRDPRMVAAESIPKQPQAQYSTKEQLVILKVAANRLGLYDASDFLDRFLGH
jgi:hypothetical protein